MSVQPVALDLGIGNEPCLVRMGQHHFLNLLKLSSSSSCTKPQFQLASTTALLGPSKPAKNCAKPFEALPSTRPSRSLRPVSSSAQSTLLLLVHIHSNVVHENSFLSFSSLRTGELLSFYLTPILSPLQRLSFILFGVARLG